MKANNIGEYLGTIQGSMTDTWKKHLKTNKYSKHIALNEFYDEVIELVDALIEEYQGIYGIVDDLTNIMDTDDKMDAIDYLKTLREFTIDGREQFIDEKDTELWSDIDAILSLIDSTVYKLENLVEGETKSLRDFLIESLG